MAYIANVTDKNQTEREAAAYEDGIGVQTVSAKTRIVSRGRQGGSQRTQNAGSTLRCNAGVVLNNDDLPNVFPEATVGRRA